MFVCDGLCITHSFSFSVTFANIATNNISLKTRFFWLHFCRIKCRYIFNHVYVMRLKATEFGEIIQPSKSLKVTDFGTNRKLI